MLRNLKVNTRIMNWKIFWVCAFLLFINTIQKMNFQRNIFVYWETPMNQAPLTVKASYEKLQYAAQMDGWKLHLLSGSNIKEYLPDYDHFQDIVSKGHRQTVHEKSDILRIYLIEQHGGVWLDFSSVLFQSLDWLSDDELFDQLIINKVGTSTDDPDMLMIGEGTHQSPYSYYNSDNRLVSEEYFGTAIHFIAAKRKSRIMTAWKEKYDLLVTQSFKEMMPRIIKNRIYLKNIYYQGVYLSGNVAFEQVIQQKQQQLDDKIGLLDIFSRRQNVYEHFKIWQVHGEVGPIALTRLDHIYFVNLFSKTKEEIQQKIGKLWFYIKINGFWRNQVWSRQQITQKYFRRHRSKNVSNIMAKGPTDEECKLYFIVKGSIMHILYENSKYLNQIETPFITVEQRQILRRHCAQKNQEMYKIEKEYRWESWGQATKVFREVQYANMTSFWEKISIIPIVYKRELDFARLKWQDASSAILVYLLLRNLINFAKEILNFIKKKSNNRKQRQIFSLSSLKDTIKLANLKSKIFYQFTKKNFPYLLSWLGFNILGIALLLGKGLAYVVNYQFIEEFDQKGYMGHWTKLCVIIGYNVILDWVIGKFINQKDVNKFISMETILKETRMLLYLPLGYVAVLHLDILFGFAHRHTMNFVAGGLLLYTWLEEIKERKIGFSLLNRVVSILSNTKWAFLSLFIIYGLNKNIRYLRTNYLYVKEYVAHVINGGFWFLLYASAATVVSFFCRKLFFSQCIQNQTQTDAEKKRRQLEKANIYHCLLMLLMIWLVICKTSEIYESKMDSLFTFNFLALFKILIGIYMLCATLIRLSLSSQMYIAYGILLTLLSFLPIIYILLGQELQRWFDWRPMIKSKCQTLIIIVFVIVEQFRSQRHHNVQKMEIDSTAIYEEINSWTEQDQEKELQMMKN